MLGAGVSARKGAVGIYHQGTQWRPSDLGVIDRNVSAELARRHVTPEGKEVKQGVSQRQVTQRVEDADRPAPSTGTKESLVAEPDFRYRISDYKTCK